MRPVYRTGVLGQPARPKANQDDRAAEPTALQTLRKELHRDPAWCARVLGIPLVRWVRLEQGVERFETVARFVAAANALIDARQAEDAKGQPHA